MSEFYYVRTRGEGGFMRGYQEFTREWQKVPAAEVREFEELEIVTEEEYRRKHARKAEKPASGGKESDT